MAQPALRQFGLASVTFLVLAGCQAGQGPFSGAGRSDEAATDEPFDATVTARTTTRLVDRDVEAPEVFQIEAVALWDGRPSLGGVWVASPEAKDPERVIMRNPKNGKFVIGALFRRERDMPGPDLQMSSDAAEALGFLAGQPGQISVTALRREEAPATTDPAMPLLDAAETVPQVQAGSIDPSAGAAAAIDRAEAAAGMPAADAAASSPAAKRVPTMDPATIAAAAPASADMPAPAASPPAAAAGGMRIQIGIFSREANARRAVEALARAGITGTIRADQSQGDTYWSVTAQGDAATLAKARSAGFADAYLIRG